MYKIIEIKAYEKISEDRSKSLSKYFKIRNWNELKEIDIWEYIELKNLWVEELPLYWLEDLKKIINSLIKEEKKLITECKNRNV